MFQSNQQVGPYTLIRLLGRGAFGEVWLAEKRNSLLARQVALKLPLDPDPDVAAIQKEAQTWLHAGHHPNVLPVIDAEVANGQVMIASEYASGGSLKDWLNQHGGKAPSVEAAIEMATGILSGLEHLHNLRPQPIIHRDLKPDNVLLQNGIPRVTDFGISRVMKTTAYTHHSAGTPSYMPPEAFDGKYSAQSDIWAMGIMLYQMLSGRLPFPQTDMVPLFGAITKHDYDALPPDIPERLRAIVTKALSKDTTQRFASAAEMRDALNAKPHVPPQVNPTPAQTDATVIEAKTVGSLVSPSYKQNRAKLAPKRANSLWRRILLFLLLACVIPGFVFFCWQNRDSSQLTLSENPISNYDSLSYNTMLFYTVAWSPDSKYIITEYNDGTAKVWNAATGAQVQMLKGPTDQVVWSPDCKYFVSRGGAAKVWNAATGAQVQMLNGFCGEDSVAWSPDGKYIVTGNTCNFAYVWNATTGAQLELIGYEGRWAHRLGISSVAWSPDGKYIVTGSLDHTAKVWNGTTGAQVQTLTGHTDQVTSVAWSPDSKYIVTGSEDHTAKVWNAVSGDCVQTLRGHKKGVMSVAWSPDGKYIVTGSRDLTAKVWWFSP
jgi:eukaryotic-like serine/threonine-protein kinase